MYCCSEWTLLYTQTGDVCNIDNFHSKIIIIRMCVMSYHYMFPCKMLDIFKYCSNIEFRDWCQMGNNLLHGKSKIYLEYFFYVEMEMLTIKKVIK